MRLFLKIISVLLAPVILAVGVLIFGPRERVGPLVAFDVSQLQDGVSAYLERQEDRFDDIVPGTEKRVVWDGDEGAKTPYAVVYLHGFSASSEETRPVPDFVARHLGANLYFARLKGHGRTGEAMARARANEWGADLVEAVAVGEKIGEKVILIGTSTGGTLAALAALDADLSQNLAGVIFISPNFAVQAPGADLLALPLARHWGPIVAGATRESKQPSEEAAKYWTTSYPTEALVPLMVLVDHVDTLDFTKAEVPALFYFSKQDQVVKPEVTQAVAESWGGAAIVHHPKLTPQDDPGAHVIAGRLRSPKQTLPTAKTINDWLKSQGIKKPISDR